MATALIFKKNKELAGIFLEMSDCYKYLGKNERYRALAYENAAKTLSNLEKPIEQFGDDIKKLDVLKGIGTHIAAKIVEYLHTGKISGFEEIKKKVPFGIFSLMQIEGIGPATIRHLHEQFPVDNKVNLVKAIKANPLLKIKGISSTNLRKIKRELQIGMADIERVPYQEAVEIAAAFLSFIRNISGVIKSDLAGSIRRKKETIGDIDIIVATENKSRELVIASICESTQIKRIVMKGKTKLSVILNKKNMQADIRLVNENQYGSAWLYLTGSKEHNIFLRKLASVKGWKLNEYGLFELENNRNIASVEEKDIYEKLGLQWIPPDARTGKNEWNEFALYRKRNSA